MIGTAYGSVYLVGISPSPKSPSDTSKTLSNHPYFSARAAKACVVAH